MISKKRIVVVGLVAVGAWLLSAVAQFFFSFNVKYSLLSGSSCQLTGFPIADCVYNNSFILVDIINILFWFVLIYLLSHFFRVWSKR